MKLSFIYGQTKYYILCCYYDMNHHSDSVWGIYFTVARALMEMIHCRPVLEASCYGFFLLLLFQNSLLLAVLGIS